MVNILTRYAEKSGGGGGNNIDLDVMGFEEKDKISHYI